MELLDVAWVRSANAAAGGLIVLTAGSLAVRLCREPVRRARLVILTLFGALAIPLMAALPVAPRWSMGLLPIPSPAVASQGETPIREEARRPRTTLAKEPKMVADPIGVMSAGPVIETRLTGPTPEMPDPRRWMIPSARSVVLGTYAVVAAGLTSWWLLGRAMLWRITRTARPASVAVRELFLEIAGPGGARVRLLESDRVALPFTDTTLRPVILLPKGLFESGASSDLRYVLAHEWSHVERRDSWAWSFAGLAGVILFYQPLFWWLRRQLHLCQDYLADARAAATGSAEDYAAYLVGLARIHRRGRQLPALGIGGRRSDLYRRVTMLVQDRGPLERRCRMAWTLATAVGAVAVIVAASGLRLDASTPPDGRPSDKAVESSRTWKGHVTDKVTGKPVAGAEVVVEISTSRDEVLDESKVLREARLTTGDDGAYEFTISPDEAGDRLLYVTLTVTSRDHVEYFGGYSYAMILKNERLGERPFYENLAVAPGRGIEGVVKSPDGKPAADVKILAFSAPDDARDPDGSRNLEGGRSSETRTDAEGRFRLVRHRSGKAVFWILPQYYAPEAHVLKDDAQGDIGAFTLAKGVRLRGRLVDSGRKPVAGVYVEAGRLGGDQQGEEDILIAVTETIHRATQTAADGTFEFRPLPPGNYEVVPTEGGYDPSTREGAHDPPRRPLPAAFIPQELTLEEVDTPIPIEIQAVPHVVVEARLTNSKGEKRAGHDISLSGDLGEVDWNILRPSTPDGTYRFLAPRGLAEAQLTLSTNEHSVLLFRTEAGAPLRLGRRIHLGTLDRDAKGIEIVRYDAPILLIKVTTKDGDPVEGFMPSVDYTAPDPDRDGEFGTKVAGGSDVRIEKQDDGRYRTQQLAPDREVEVKARAAGFRTASRKLSLAEGKVEEVVFVLEPE